MARYPHAIAAAAVALGVFGPALAQEGAPPPAAQEDPAAKAREDVQRQRQQDQQKRQQQRQEQLQQRQQQIQQQQQERQQQNQERLRAIQEQRAKAREQRQNELEQRQRALEQQRQQRQQQQTQQKQLQQQLLEEQRLEREKQRRAEEKAREERALQKKQQIEAEQQKQRQEQDRRLEDIQERQDRAREERNRVLERSTPPSGGSPQPRVVAPEAPSKNQLPPSTPGDIDRRDRGGFARPATPRPVESQQQFEARRQAIEANRQRIIERRDALRQDRMRQRAERIDQFRERRRERVEAQGRRTIIEEPGNRRIFREGNRTFIEQDQTQRLRQTFRDRDTRVERRRDGSRVTIITQPNRVQIISVQDEYGRLIRRYRRFPDGREFTLIDNRRLYWDARGRPRFRGRDRSYFDFVINLPPPRLSIPQDRYILDYEEASDEDIYEALSAPPVEDLDRNYSYDEVRSSHTLRDRMRRVDLDSVTFDTGSWYVGIAQIPKLERVARAMQRLIDRNPDEVFLIEGHTDAVGSDIDNLSLSDRRAESVASILTQEFGVPAENLTTQGYGEEFLKIQTEGPERINRRVAVRRITPLLARSDSRDDRYWREEREESRYDDRGGGDDRYRDDDGEDDSNSPRDDRFRDDDDR